MFHGVNPCQPQLLDVLMNNKGGTTNGIETRELESSPRHIAMKNLQSWVVLLANMGMKRTKKKRLWLDATTQHVRSWNAPIPMVNVQCRGMTIAYWLSMYSSGCWCGAMDNIYIYTYIIIYIYTYNHIYIYIIIYIYTSSYIYMYMYIFLFASDSFLLFLSVICIPILWWKPPEAEP